MNGNDNSNGNGSRTVTLITVAIVAVTVVIAAHYTSIPRKFQAVGVGVRANVGTLK